MKFCERIKELRNETGKTQAELADALGVKRYTVADWEQSRSRPCFEDLMAMAKFFDVTTDYLLGMDDFYK